MNTKYAHRTVYLKGERLSLTPWAAQRLSDDEQLRLTERAASMGVRVSAGMSGKEWTIRVVSDMTRTRYGSPEPLALHSFHHLTGNLSMLIGRCLDEYERREAWTDEEILTIANQSGIEVSRG